MAKVAKRRDVSAGASRARCSVQRLALPIDYSAHLAPILLQAGFDQTHLQVGSARFSTTDHQQLLNRNLGRARNDVPAVDGFKPRRSAEAKSIDALAHRQLFIVDRPLNFRPVISTSKPSIRSASEAPAMKRDRGLGDSEFDRYLGRLHASSQKILHSISRPAPELAVASWPGDHLASRDCLVPSAIRASEASTALGNRAALVVIGLDRLPIGGGWPGLDIRIAEATGVAGDGRRVDAELPRDLLSRLPLTQEVVDPVSHANPGSPPTRTEHRAELTQVKLPGMDSNHRSSVQSRVSCH